MEVSNYCIYISFSKQSIIIQKARVKMLQNLKNDALFGRFRAQFGKATQFVRWTALSLPLGIRPNSRMFRHASSWARGGSRAGPGGGGVGEGPGLSQNLEGKMTMFVYTSNVITYGSLFWSHLGQEPRPLSESCVWGILNKSRYRLLYMHVCTIDLYYHRSSASSGFSSGKKLKGVQLEIIKKSGQSLQTFIVASGKKTQGGVQFEILKISRYRLIVASGKPLKGGGGTRP